MFDKIQKQGWNTVYIYWDIHKQPFDIFKHERHLLIKH